MMTRFFAQLLLSVMIGLSAAVGFNLDARSELKQTLREAGTLVQGTAKAALKTAGDLFAQGDVKFAASMDASADGNVEANSSSSHARGKGDADIQLTGDGTLKLDPSPVLNVDGSLSADSRTQVEVDTKNAGLDLKEKIKSALDFSFGN